MLRASPPGELFSRQVRHIRADFARPTPLTGRAYHRRPAPLCGGRPGLVSVSAAAARDGMSTRRNRLHGKEILFEGHLDQDLSGSRGVPVRVGRGPGCFPRRCAHHVRPRRARRRRTPPHASLPVSARAFALCAAPSSTRARDRDADRTGAVRRGRAGRRWSSTEAAGPAVGGVSRVRGGGSGSRAAGPWPGRGRATAAATRRGRPP